MFIRIHFILWLLVIICCLSIQQRICHAFIVQTKSQLRTKTALHESGSKIMESNSASSSTSLGDERNTRRKNFSYKHNHWNLTYQYQPASPGNEDKPPILLIHPVGIGLSSWFWNKLMDQWAEKGPALYAVDLMGCGLERGADAWDPEQADRGLFFPLSWVEACETLIKNVILPRQLDNERMKVDSNILGLIQNLNIRADKQTEKRRSCDCIVIAQGGLAPVGVVLAYRNNYRLVLTSPPSWKDMTTPIPKTELQFNYNFLRSPVLGELAFSILESRTAVRFFSNLFLFSKPCSEEWLDLVTTGEQCSKQARPPVQAFNAGFLNHRSFIEEMKGIERRTMILSGEDDKRGSERVPYFEEMKDCTLETIPGQNVLPWENYNDVICAVERFLGMSGNSRDI